MAAVAAAVCSIEALRPSRVESWPRSAGPTLPARLGLLPAADRQHSSRGRARGSPPAGTPSAGAAEAGSCGCRTRSARGFSAELLALLLGFVLLRRRG